MGSLININGKPLEKLIDVIAIGVGKIYNKKEIKRGADAKAYEIKVTEKAKLKADLNRIEKTSELEHKINARVNYIEEKRQQNIENISYVAAELLQEETKVSEQQVDEDWITRFFNISQDVSNEEMQKLWGKILAGEVKEPNSYSLRTLDILKNISQTEAETFNILANIRLELHDSAFIAYGVKTKYYVEKELGLNYNYILLMQEIGLLSSSITTALVLKNDAPLCIFTGSKMLKVDTDSLDRQSVKIGVLIFTKSGFELARILESKFDIEYMRLIREEFIKSERKVIESKLEITLHNVYNRNSEEIEHSTPIPFD